MKTIEERANEYADTKVIPYDDPMYDAWRQAIMNDYWAGAKDQKKIDIEKACEYIKANVNDYIIEVGEDWHADNIVGSNFIDDFRKAMEEEI